MADNDSSDISPEAMEAILSEKKEYFNKQYDLDKKSLPFPGMHFQILKKLSESTFGLVELVRDSVTEELLALKRISRAKFYDEYGVREMRNEKRIHSSLDHPFIVKMKQHYQNKKFLYLTTEFCPGRDFQKFLVEKGTLDEDCTIFYASQVFLALEFMHSLGLIHRDLQPENILIDADGYIKLTDMGFCKKINGSTSSIKYSYDYSAPEIMDYHKIDRKQYNQSADWWSFGILIYEMLIGCTPFRLEYGFMSCYKMPIHYPEHISEESRDILEELLQLDVAHRLGCGTSGPAAIKDHEFFSEVDWEMMFFKKYEAPYVPEIDPAEYDSFDIDFSEDEEEEDEELAKLKYGEYSEFKDF